MPEVKPSGPTRDDIDQFLGPRGENVELGTADKANVFEKAADLVSRLILVSNAWLVRALSAASLRSLLLICILSTAGARRWRSPVGQVV